MVSFLLSFFRRDVLDEILNLIESVSEGFPTYSYQGFLPTLTNTLVVVIRLLLACVTVRSAFLFSMLMVHTYYWPWLE